MKIANGVEVVVRPYVDEDAQAIVKLIHRNFLEVNSKDYGIEEMQKLAEHHNTDWLRSIASFSNVYSFCVKDEIIGVGAIASYWGSLTESTMLLIFVLPEYHGMGIGRYIVETLEQDELFLRANRVEIPASITATEFYRKLGYDYKDGVKRLDEEGHYILEKYKKHE